MLEKHGKEIVLSSLLILLAIAVILVGTYAYFGGKIKGNDTDTSILLTATNEGYDLRFSGGEQIDLAGIFPRTDAWATKDVTLSVSPKSDKVNPIYIFGLVVNKNTYAKEDIQYTFTMKEQTNVEGYTEVSNMTPLAQNYDIARGTMDINAGSSVTYTLNVYFVNDPNRNQNTGEEQNLNFYVTCSFGKPIEVEIVDGENVTNTTLPKKAIVDLGKPSKEGYEFLNWTLVSGSDATLSGTKLTMGEQKVTLTQRYRELTEFEKISWATLAQYVRDKDYTKFTVGDTRKIDIKGKSYQVRVANNSNYDCTFESKTACGLVMEFVDIVEQRVMNNRTNRLGWPKTKMREYLNGEFLAKLPSDLQSVIMDTKVVSGHGSDDSSNFTSTDKIYLLSTGEIWSDCTKGDKCSDTASYPYQGNGAITTRQLDYYSNKSVSISNNAYAAKKFNGTDSSWWLRAAYSYDNYSFRIVYFTGSSSYEVADLISVGVSPAFRIG